MSDNALLREISFSIAGQVTSTRVTEPQGRSSQFAYGPDRARFLRRDYENASAVGAYKRTLYLGGTEIIRTLAGVTETKRYIGGIVIDTRRSNGVNSTEYIFTDHLGSTDVITDSQGVVQQAQSFGAFGERRSETWAGLSVTLQQTFDTSRTTRGYTGHEQIDGTGLIHMNARLYDPETGRFISADTLIENAAASQAFNRYSYVMNNPLSYTDPTGHYMSRAQRNVRAVVAIAAVIITGGYAAGWFTATGAAAVSTASAWTAVIAGGAISGAITSGKLEGALIGALEAAAFRAIGLSKLTDGPRIAAHSLAGGVFSALQGGSFGHGFVSAGLGKFLDVKILDGIEDPALYALANVAAGGTVSAVTGGKFASGALTAAFQVSFNGFTKWLGDIGGGIRDGAGLISDELRLPTGRRLTSGEKALLTSVFGASLNVNKIRVVASADLVVAGVGTEGRTIGNKIRLFGDSRSDDYSTTELDMQSLFIHEATHVWQNQNIKNYTHLKAAAEQGKPGAYSENLTHANFRRYGYEQQASIVAKMFSLQESMNLTSRAEMRQFLKIQSVVYGPGGISR